MLEPWAPLAGYDVSATGGSAPFVDSYGNPIAPGGTGNFGAMGGGGQIDGLLKALQGVKAPAAPETPKVNMISAPAPRAPTPVRGDQFLQLLQMLGNGPSAAAPPPIAIQPRLSQALGVR